MNDEMGSAPEEEIVERILKDGEAQAKRVADGARRTEAAEQRKAESEAEKIRKEALEQAGSRARAIKSKEIASATIKAKRMLLKAREEAVSKVFADIGAEVAKVRSDQQEYLRALLALAVEAVSAVGGDKITLRIDPGDRALVDDAFLERIAEGVAGVGGASVEIRVESDRAVAWGGCIAVSADGRVVFDNSFKRRLERMKPELRSVIAKEVLKADG